MNFIEFEQQFSEFLVFSLDDIRLLAPNFRRADLTDWQQKGYLKKIIKKYYTFSDISLTTEKAHYISNYIYSPSYISLESALAYYQLIPDSVFAFTAVSTRKTQHFSTFIGQFSYRKIKAALFFGYQLVPINDRHIKIATLEKAILDFLYLNASYQTPSDFYSLRINTSELQEKLNKERFDGYLTRFNNRQLEKRAFVFWEYINNA